GPPGTPPPNRRSRWACQSHGRVRGRSGVIIGVEPRPVGGPERQSANFSRATLALRPYSHADSKDSWSARIRLGQYKRSLFASTPYLVKRLHCALEFHRYDGHWTLTVHQPGG